MKPSNRNMGIELRIQFAENEYGKNFKNPHATVKLVNCHVPTNETRLSETAIGVPISRRTSKQASPNNPMVISSISLPNSYRPISERQSASVDWRSLYSTRMEISSFLI